MASLAELYGTAKAKARQIPANLRASGKGLASWAVDPYGEAQRVMGEYRNMTPEQRQGLVNAAVDLFGGIDVGPVGAIKASHGSPHAFTAFDFSKMGTGEGAQAYGHGGYFAQGFDSPVAKEYQKQLAADVQIKGQPFYSGKSGKQLSTTGNPELDDYLMTNLGDVGAARANLLSDLRDVRSGGGDVKDYQRTLADLRNIRGDVENVDLGHLYNVELKWPDVAREASDPLGEHHLLDWDAPLSEQPGIVAKLGFSTKTKDQIHDEYDALVAKHGYYHEMPPEIQAKVEQLQNELNNQVPNLTGEQFYSGNTENDYLHSVLSGKRFSKEQSDYLRNLGIPGIRYLDQSSRGQGAGTRNYVMFDDRFPNIVTRNGVSITDLIKNR